jgi:type IV pilus assembly protein PilV
MKRQQGTTLVEVLVTIVILAFGLLGVAVFQAKSTVGSLESYQRAQAVILLEDMSSRIQGNPGNAAGYLATGIGTGDARPDDCTGQAAGPVRDLCEWSSALKGSAETDPGNTKVGAMIGARGCVEQVQEANPASGVCTPAIYRVSVAWQGMHETVAPALECGKNLYGSEGNRRVIAVQVVAPLLDCN